MEKVLRRLDSIHEKLLGAVSPLDPRTYSKRPAEGQWSVAEVVHHLGLVEARVVQELESAIARPPVRINPLKRFLPTSIVSIRSIRVKAPKAMRPLDAPSREVGIGNLESARASLKQLCTVHGKERLRNLVFKHPFFGEIDGVATVSFIGYHELRHYKQIREVVRKVT